MMKLEENPFYLLGAGVDSTRADITQKADDKCFDEPEREEDIEKAKGILLNPQRRIGAEIRWFPGCCGSIFQQNLASKFQGMDANAMGVNGLCKLNILLLQLHGAAQADEVVNKILAVDELYSRISLEEIRQWLNRDRQKSKLPEIQELQSIEVAWQEYRQDIRQQLMGILNQHNEFDILVNKVAKGAANKGSFGQVLQDFIASYNLSTEERKHRCFDEAIDKLSGMQSSTPTMRDIEAVIPVIENVLVLAKPVCIMNEALGINSYPQAVGIFNELSDTAVALWEKGYEEEAIRLMEIMVEAFKDVRAIHDQAYDILQTGRKNHRPSNKKQSAETEEEAVKEAEERIGCLMPLVITVVCCIFGPVGVAVGLIALLVLAFSSDD